MTRATRWLLLAGLLLFIALLTWHGLSAVLSALSRAGTGLLLVALFHVVIVVIDGAAMSVLFGRGCPGGSLRDTTLTRWVGESVNSLMPAGQLGGPVMMVRQLAQRGAPLPIAGAVITVATTYQMLGQMVFALTGLALLGAHQRSPLLLISIAVLCLILGSFYLVQRRGLFRSTMGLAHRFLGPHRMSSLMGQAEALDQSVGELYGKRLRGAGSFALNLLGWLIGTAEAYLILWFMKAPVSWESALLLESLGQAVRGAAFAIPGSLGVQEGGFLLLAPFAGLTSDAALALSLAKRARELLLGVPGLLYLHGFERRATAVDSHAARRTIL